MGAVKAWLMDMEECVFDAYAEVAKDSDTFEVNPDDVVFLAMVNATEREVMLTANTALSILESEMSRECEYDEENFALHYH